MQAKKRAAAIAVMCMLLLMLSGQQQQVAAMSKFCRCYRQCLPECRHTAPKFICKGFCLNKCSPNKAGDGITTSYCRAACGLDSICGSSVLPTADAACARGCNQKRSHN